MDNPQQALDFCRQDLEKAKSSNDQTAQVYGAFYTLSAWESWGQLTNQSGGF